MTQGRATGLGGFAAALVAACFGYAQACAVAMPWALPGLPAGQPVWWLQIASLAGLAGLVQRAPSVRRAAGLGGSFALAWLVGSVWWLYTSMHDFGGLAAPLAVLAVLALCAVLSVYYAAACGAYKHFSQFAGVSIDKFAIVFAALWMLAELARDQWFTGFPWAAGGYSHTDGPLAALAPLVGVHGIGLAASFIACVVAGGVLRKKVPWQQGLGVAALLLGGALAGYGLWGGAGEAEAAAGGATGGATDGAWPLGTRPAGSTRVALLQGNIPQGEKFDNSKGIPLALDWYRTQLLQNTATLVVAPETAIPMLPQQLPPGYWEDLQQRFKTGGQAALIGVPLGSYTEGYTNSAIGLWPTRLDLTAKLLSPQPYRYDKHHLVPFGEFIPPWFKWFTQMMNIPLGDFNRGAVGQASLDWAGQRWAPNICYEDLFGDELSARFVDASAAPTVLVNMGNIGWFGNSIAIDQHLQISRMRAIELGRPVLRATNTGPTVIIDHRGVVSASLPRHTRGVLLGEVEGRSGTTPYAWWAGRAGLWPLWLLAIAIVFVAVKSIDSPAKRLFRS